MKKIIAVLCLALCSAPVLAKEITITNYPFGSGSQDATTTTQAQETFAGSGLYHAPEYLPGYPTAGVIWPRVVDVDCNATGTDCKGYDWSPALGRGEYLFIRPHFAPTAVILPPPVVVVKELPIKE